ncbi:MAG TPA: hypothetical protein VK661_13615 [Planctomycetota bacterium]|nr:hypothetical protein [Planctomycetota bacterium]
MELATQPTWSPRQTIRQFVGALILMGVLVGLFRLGMAIEPVANPREGVVANNAIRAATIFTGIAHFTIAFLFMWTDPRAATRESRKRILAALLIGGAVCASCFAVASVLQSFFLAGFVGLYFLTHEIRDEYLFSRTYGDIPGKGLGRNGAIRIIGAVLCVAAAIGWNYLFVKRTNRGGVKILRPWIDLDTLGIVERLIWWLVPLGIFVLVAAVLFVTTVRKSGRPIGKICREYWPLFIVYGGLALMLTADLRHRSALYLVVLFHVAAWWVFTTRRLAAKGRTGGPRELGWLEWFKRTQAGFQSLHIGLTLATVLLAVVWVYVFRKSEGNALAWIVTPGAFSYWTIMHVTVSFIPKPA